MMSGIDINDPKVLVSIIIAVILIIAIIISLVLKFDTDDTKISPSPPEPEPPIETEPPPTEFGDTELPHGTKTGMLKTNVFQQRIRDGDGLRVGYVIWGVTVYDDNTLHLFLIAKNNASQPGLLWNNMNFYGSSGTVKPDVASAKSFRILDTQSQMFVSADNTEPPLRALNTERGLCLQIASKKLGDDIYQWDWLYPLIKPGQDVDYDSLGDIDPKRSGIWYTGEGLGVAQFMIFYYDDEFMINSRDNTFIWPNVRYIHKPRTVKGVALLEGVKVWGHVHNQSLRLDYYHTTRDQMLNGSCQSVSLNTADEVECNYNEAFKGLWLNRIPAPGSVTAVSQVRRYNHINSGVKFNPASLFQAEQIDAGCSGGFNIPLSRHEYRGSCNTHNFI